jgi:hypothetical protein
MGGGREVEREGESERVREGGGMSVSEEGGREEEQ